MSEPIISVSDCHREGEEFDGDTGRAMFLLNGEWLTVQIVKHDGVDHLRISNKMFGMLNISPVSLNEILVTQST